MKINDEYEKYLEERKILTCKIEEAEQEILNEIYKEAKKLSTFIRQFPTMEVSVFHHEVDNIKIEFEGKTYYSAYFEGIKF